MRFFFNLSVIFVLYYRLGKNFKIERTGMNMNWKNKEELLEFAQKLENSSIALTITRIPSFEIYTVAEPSLSYSGKGKFGDYLEEEYFGKKNDSKSKPDFEEIGVELKAVPLKVLENGEVKVKERIVLNTFRYVDIAKETFETSHFLAKDSTLLLVFYFHDNSVPLENKKIDLVDLWEVLKHDIEQIREDWETIVGKVREGKAHEISEGDTLYLGACTKGTNRASSMQKQPFSNELAPGRALCFKTSYANMIYHLLKEEHENRRKVQSNSIYTKEGGWKPLDLRIHELVDGYIGKTVKELYCLFRIKDNSKNKSRYALIARKMLGFFRGKPFYEFEAADIQVKSIRIEKNGLIEQAMSFKNIPYKDIVSQDWEDSDFYNELTSKFIFMLFKKYENSDDYVFAGVYLWNMPVEDLDKAQEVWERAKHQVLIDDFENMPNIGFNGVAHVRPKARKAENLMETAYGTKEKKKCFWLNNNYIREVVKKLMDDENEKA